MNHKLRRRSTNKTSPISRRVPQVEADQQQAIEAELSRLMSAQLRERLFGDSNSQHLDGANSQSRNQNHQFVDNYIKPSHMKTIATKSDSHASKMTSIRKQLARGRSTLASATLALAIAMCLLAVLDSSGQLAWLGVHGAKLPDIYWNSSNPIFRIDNTDHIFDVNRKLHDHDQVDLVCPQAPPASSELAAANKSADYQTPAERYIIYSVSKDEYETCRLQAASAARPVAICDQAAAGKPNRPPITITFRSFTPQPNGLEFKPGQDYYFITALNQPAEPGRRFAPCREQNMKVIFKICCKGPGATGSSGGSTLAAGAQSSGLAGMLATNRKPLAGSQPTSQQQQVSTRPAVMTMRPTFKPAGPLGFVLPTGPAPAPVAQPVTVLPIEDIRPAPEDSNESWPSGASEPSSITQSSEQAGTSESGLQKTSDIQNEQPNRQPAQMPRWISESGRAAGNAPPGNFIPFDPLARPDAINRWAPTPLPPRLLPSNSHFNHLQQHQQQDLSQPKPFPLQQEAPANAGQRHQPSRLGFYPWNPSPARDIMQTQPQDQQQQQQSQSASTAAGPPTLALALLLPLFALVILLALGLERRLR